MFGQTRRSPLEDIFNFQRDADRIFTRLWNELPTTPPSTTTSPLQVYANDDGWRVDVPMPGIDPQHVTLEVTGNTLAIRAEADGGGGDGEARFEQTLTMPPFLDLDKITAAHRHGMLQLTLPLKESVKPRRIQIDGVSSDRGATPRQQLTTA